MHDEMYMARAMKLAQRGRFTTHPNPNVGCVIVKDGEIVGEGFHYRAGEPHAEVHALRMAGDRRIWWRFHLYSLPMLLWAALVGYGLLQL